MSVNIKKQSELKIYILMETMEKPWTQINKKTHKNDKELSVYTLSGKRKVKMWKAIHC